MHCKNPYLYPWIFLAFVCLFEIFLVCLEHGTPEDNGSRNLSFEGLSLEQTYASSYSRRESERFRMRAVVTWIRLEALEN